MPASHLSTWVFEGGDLGGGRVGGLKRALTSPVSYM